MNTIRRLWLRTAAGRQAALSRFQQVLMDERNGWGLGTECNSFNARMQRAGKAFERFAQALSGVKPQP